MRLEALETVPQWRATVEYHGSHGRQTVCLMESTLMDGSHYWFIADYQGEWPWQAIRPFDPAATGRMVEGGKMRLVKGQWPDILYPVGRSMSMPSQQEIYAKVAATLVEALNVDEDEVKPTSTLQGDLGAESIDFLDIVFRLEREFGIKIPRGELFPESIFQGDPDFVQNGRVTPKGLEELRERMPFADLSGFEKNPEVSKLSDLFTVDLITRYLQGKLRQQNIA